MTRSKLNTSKSKLFDSHPQHTPIARENYLILGNQAALLAP